MPVLPRFLLSRGGVIERNNETKNFTFSFFFPLLHCFSFCAFETFLFASTRSSCFFENVRWGSRISKPNV